VWSIASPVAIEGARTTYRFLTYLTVVEAGDLSPEAGLLVFDSGLEAGEGLARSFRERGLDPLSVTHVFHSHMHIDHFGGDRLFTRALKLMSREELDYQRRWNREFFEARDRAAFLAERFPHLSKVESERIADMLLHGQSKHFKEETLGDPGLFRFFEDLPGFDAAGNRDAPGEGAGAASDGILPPGFSDFVGVIPTPGHTPHHVSFVVRGGKGAAIVTGDLFPARKSFYGETDGFIEVYCDREEAARSRSRVARVGEGIGDPVICPAHDRPFRFRSGKYVGVDPWSIDG
jgi:glyoxylase-like metal-dependent hydrolase (beta-lactamase superfamily II)